MLGNTKYITYFIGNIGNCKHILEKLLHRRNFHDFAEAISIVDSLLIKINYFVSFTVHKFRPISIFGQFYQRSVLHIYEITTFSCEWF